MRVGKLLLGFGFATGLLICGACQSDRPEPAGTTRGIETDRTVRPGRLHGTADSRPDILLLTIDTLRKNNLPFYGYATNTAPFLSSLAARATVYRRAYSSSSWTVPAVASTLTGVYPTTHGAIHGVVKQDRVLHLHEWRVMRVQGRRGHVACRSCRSPSEGFEWRSF